MRAGVFATYLVVPILACYPLLPGHGRVDLAPFYALTVLAMAGAVVVSHLPWDRLFAAGHGITVRYAWSVLDIVLVTAVIAATGGPGASPMFMIYSLTTIFFAASYPRRDQVVLLVFTFACYLVLIPGSGVGAAVVVVRLGVLGALAFMGSFISGELMRQISQHETAVSESERRARLLATVAEAASRVSVLEPDDVLDAVLDCVPRLGLEAADLCLLDEAAGTYVVVGSRGLPAVYDTRPHDADTGLVGQVRVQGRTVTAGDYSALPDVADELRDAGFLAVAAIPVWVQGELVAVLGGGTRLSPCLSRDTVEALEMLAALAGRALENARRFEDERRMVERLAHLDHLKSDFISTASHELRTPLTVVLGMSTTLVSQWGNLDDGTRASVVERIEANARRLDDVVNSLLDFARIESGSLGVRTAVLDLGLLGQRVADRLEPLFSDRPFAVEAGPGACVEADAALLEQVVENLLGNAAKHTGPGTPVTVAVRVEDGDVVLEVRDEGPGIPSEELAHVTERFFRGGEPNTRASGGLGLGLAIVREVLDRHGTTLEIESEPGRGSCFAFRLPAVSVSAPAPAY